MRVIEPPAFRDWPFHGEQINGDYYGQFVLLSFDPVASVAALEDPIATQAATNLARGKYLALVVDIGRISILNPDDEYKLNLEFWMIGDGPPAERPAASIPIFPASFHPNGRRSVHPSGPLPWSNLYVHSFFNFSAAVSRVHVGNNPCDARIGSEVVFEMRVQRLDDKVDLENEEQAVRDATRREQGLPSPTHSSPPLDSGSSSLVMDEEEVVDQELQAMREKLGQMVVYVEVWLDLHDCDRDRAFGAPKDFLPPLDELQKIWADWEERAMTEYLAKRPRTTAWAQDVATMAVVEAADLPASSAPNTTVDSRNGIADGGDGKSDEEEDDDIDNDAIFPEDAVDYNLQKDPDTLSASFVPLPPSPFPQPPIGAQVDQVLTTTNAVQAPPSSDRPATTPPITQDRQNAPNARAGNEAGVQESDGSGRSAHSRILDLALGYSEDLCTFSPAVEGWFCGLRGLSSVVPEERNHTYALLSNINTKWM